MIPDPEYRIKYVDESRPGLGLGGTLFVQIIGGPIAFALKIVTFFVVLTFLFVGIPYFAITGAMFPAAEKATSAPVQKVQVEPSVERKTTPLTTEQIMERRAIEAEKRALAAEQRAQQDSNLVPVQPARASNIRIPGHRYILNTDIDAQCKPGWIFANERDGCEKRAGGNDPYGNPLVIRNGPNDPHGLKGRQVGEISHGEPRAAAPTVVAKPRYEDMPRCPPEFTRAFQTGTWIDAKVANVQTGTPCTVDGPTGGYVCSPGCCARYHAWRPGTACGGWKDR